MRIAIAGAGIGGLTAGLCLARSGHQIDIFEKVNQFAEIGAGIQCGANAMHVFDYLGLSQQLERVAVSPERIVFKDYRSGDPLQSMALGEAYESKYGAPYLHIHRADLHSILLDEFLRVMPDGLHLGSSLESFVETDSSVQYCQRGNAYDDADCLIAADGIHSALRKQIVGDVSPRFTGNVAWRGVVPVEALPDNWMDIVASNFVGPKKHMVLYYLRDKTLANFVGVVESQQWNDDSWAAKASWEELKADFAGWHSCVQSIIDAVDKEQCYRWALYDHAPSDNWMSQRVTLLGDAAHATLPFMASGAAMAIEDARILQRSLDSQTSVTAGLRVYQENRMNRTAKIQKNSARAGALYHFNSPLMRKAAFSALKFAGSAKQDFLAGYNANTVELR